MSRKQFGRRGAQHRNRFANPDSQQTYWIWGHHAVHAALVNPRRGFRRIVVTKKAQDAYALLVDSRDDRPILQVKSPNEIDRLLDSGAVHQGIAAEVATLPHVDLTNVASRGELIVVLDQVSDPRNVGAIMRTASVFGADAVVLQDRRAPQPSGTLAKAASGALEWMPLIQVTNIARTLSFLSDEGFRITAFDSTGESTLDSLQLGLPRVVVFGAEGTGLRRLVKERCDEVVRIPGVRPDLSLNVSCAVSVALYGVSRDRFDQ